MSSIDTSQLQLMYQKQPRGNNNDNNNNNNNNSNHNSQAQAQPHATHIRCQISSLHNSQSQNFSSFNSSNDTIMNNVSNLMTTTTLTIIWKTELVLVTKIIICKKIGAREDRRSRNESPHHKMNKTKKLNVDSDTPDADTHNIKEKRLIIRIGPASDVDENEGLKKLPLILYNTNDASASNAHITNNINNTNNGNNGDTRTGAPPRLKSKSHQISSNKNNLKKLKSSHRKGSQHNHHSR